MCLVARASSRTAHFCLPQVGSAGARPRSLEVAAVKDHVSTWGPQGSRLQQRGVGEAGTGVPGEPRPCTLNRRREVGRTGIRGAATCPGAPGPGGWGEGLSGFPGQRGGVQRAPGSRHLVRTRGHWEWAAGQAPHPGPAPPPGPSQGRGSRPRGCGDPDTGLQSHAAPPPPAQGWAPWDPRRPPKCSDKQGRGSRSASPGRASGRAATEGQPVLGSQVAGRAVT